MTLKDSRVLSKFDLVSLKTGNPLVAAGPTKRQLGLANALYLTLNSDPKGAHKIIKEDAQLLMSYSHLRPYSLYPTSFSFSSGSKG